MLLFYISVLYSLFVMEKIQTFVFMGRPGSGKGTQAKLLAEAMSSHILASGKMFREFGKEDSPVARRVKRVLDTGGLLPHWIATYLFHREVFQYEKDTGLILDGFPRTVTEAETLADTLTWFERPFTVFHLRTKTDVVVDRIEKRFAIEHREDDKEAIKRMKEYEKHTKPALRFFEKKGRVIHIDGEGSIEDIHKEVMNHVHKLSL